MLCSLAILVSDAAPLKRIVEETGCGWLFKAGDSVSFAKKVLEINCLDDIKKCGANGRQAVLDRYNWEYDCNALSSIISQFGDS